MKKIKLCIVLPFVLLPILCGCNNAEAQPESSGVSPETEIKSTSAEETMPEASENTVPETAEETEAAVTEREYNFICYLTEEDIDYMGKYMGKPYKDLTSEETVQLWAQCTREMNTQRLYLIEDLPSHGEGTNRLPKRRKKTGC